MVLLNYNWRNLWASLLIWYSYIVGILKPYGKKRGVQINFEKHQAVITLSQVIIAKNGNKTLEYQYHTYNIQVNM